MEAYCEEIKADFAKTKLAIARLEAYGLPGERPRGAYAEALRSYADELLPAILGGEWLDGVYNGGHWLFHGRISGRQPSDCPVCDVQTVFDHMISFRRKGARGPATWKNTAMIGQPYALPRDDSEMAYWLAERGVGLWGRPDLSMWYPGSTVLTVAARGLRPEAAPRFGFVALNEARVT